MNTHRTTDATYTLTCVTAAHIIHRTSRTNGYVSNLGLVWRFSNFLYNQLYPLFGWYRFVLALA